MDLKELRQVVNSRHPWEIAKSIFFQGILEKYIGNEISKAITVLDVGAGDGFISDTIREKSLSRAKVYCWDINYTDEFLKERNQTSKVIYTREVPEEKSDLLFLMDVLEHVENDKGFLKDLVTNKLKDSSYALLTVPAWNGLYSFHDKKLYHFRRYSPSKCKEVINESGLKIIKSGGVFHSLLMFRFASVFKEKIIGEPSSLPDLGDWNHGRMITEPINWVLKVDNALSKMFAAMNLDVPGLSWWALCKK